LTSGEDLLVAFERIFVALDEEVSKSSFSGCTALVVVIVGRDCYHANVGDARCVVVRDGQPVQLSVNHSTTNTEEVERVRASGGVVLNGRVDGIIEVTRALGDAGVPLCIPNPYVCHTKLVEGDVMILGCDGIFDEISNDVLASMVTSTVGDAQYIASRVRDEAFFLGSGDNLSCICYKV
jgi:protein phosphatase PTC1